jgi:hypothetical protein
MCNTHFLYAFYLAHKHTHTFHTYTQGRKPFTQNHTHFWFTHKLFQHINSHTLFPRLTHQHTSHTLKYLLKYLNIKYLHMHTHTCTHTHTHSRTQTLKHFSYTLTHNMHAHTQSLTHFLYAHMHTCTPILNTMTLKIFGP